MPGSTCRPDAIHEGPAARAAGPSASYTLVRGRSAGHDFDFTGATFDGGDFTKAVFSGGTVNFGGAEFCGGTVDFTEAEFSGGTVNFAGAGLAGGQVRAEREQLAVLAPALANVTWAGGCLNVRNAVATSDLTCTLLVTCAVEHVGYVVGGHGLGLELSAGQSDGDVLQGA